jgi:predicted RNA binding protein YcfA (HicA-like mRNA interferase family)
MASKYPVLKPHEIITVLESFGFVKKSQKGSHVKYIREKDGEPTKTVIIPMHYEIAKGTLKSIIEQSGLTLNDFI